MDTLLQDFRAFFSTYEEMWNRCDTRALAAVCSDDLSVRWAYPGHKVSDWGAPEARVGWEEAFRAYASNSPTWSFHELMLTPISETEVLALFWVTFEMNGKATDEANLFVETFRKDAEGWQLIRSYVESSIPRTLVSHVNLAQR